MLSFLALLREDLAAALQHPSVSAHLPVPSTALIHLLLEAAAAGHVFDSSGRLYKLPLFLKGCWWTRAQLLENRCPTCKQRYRRTWSPLFSERQKRKWVLEPGRWGKAGGT